MRRPTPLLPGFSLTWGLGISLLSLLVFLPLAALFAQVFSLSAEEFIRAAFSERALAAYLLTIKAAGVSAVLTTLVGFLIAWVLVRYRFPGRALFDACIDLPFAIPTSVAGLAVAMLYDYNSWLGGWLDQRGWSPMFHWVGICLAMSFTSLPFGVRLVQTRLLQLDEGLLDAARTLGAGRVRVFLSQIVEPLAGPITGGFLLSLIRSLGEFGSIQFISGNIPFQSETVSLLLVIRLDEQDYPAAVSVVLLFFAASLSLLALAVQLQRPRHLRQRKKRDSRTMELACES